MSDQDQYQRELDVIEEVKDKGPAGKFFGYAKISGPGWLQGAITLGGGSLAGALYLGVVSGNDLLWVQPLAMICGIIMLSAIAYVTLSTEQRPLQLINRTSTRFSAGPGSSPPSWPTSYGPCPSSHWEPLPSNKTSDPGRR